MHNTILIMLSPGEMIKDGDAVPGSRGGQSAVMEFFVDYHQEQSVSGRATSSGNRSGILALSDVASSDLVIVPFQIGDFRE